MRARPRGASRHCNDQSAVLCGRRTVTRLAMKVWLGGCGFGARRAVAELQAAHE